MELIALVQESFQSAAEHAASYKMGQTVLRRIDKALWVVEKCARWAVPPPLDPEERPQPELVRPLPWVFFLMMLVALRVTRESISLVNLVLGKPPLRSADVVTYIQGKRRYLRTLKYQGNRMMRARTGTTREPWYTGLGSLFEFTMCFRRQSVHYGNNNTTRVSNNDEVLVVKRSKRPRQPDSPAASTSEASMERLIEKMMVDLDADSDEDSSYTLTNATSLKSDQSDTESDQESTPNDITPVNLDKESPKTTPEPETDVATTDDRPTENAENQTPTKETSKKSQENATAGTQNNNQENPTEGNQSNNQENPAEETQNNNQEKPAEEIQNNNQENQTEETQNNNQENQTEECQNADSKCSPKMASQTLIQNEKHPIYNRSPKKEQKMANGRTLKSTSERNIGGDRRAEIARAASAEFSTRERNENFSQTP